MPEWAPPEQNHLVRSSSVVTEVKYATDTVTYKTFDKDATEVLRLGFTPHNVMARHANSTEIEASGSTK